MDNSFFAYLQQLELMAFFSGYPMLYAFIFFIAGNKRLRNNFKRRIISVLPYVYPLLGTLYLGLQFKNLYPDYSFENIKLSMQQPWLIGWGLLSILFWIPALGKKIFLSLIHSLVFFYFLARDLFLQLSASAINESIVKNDMNVYTNSLLLNTGVFTIILLLSFLFIRNKKV
ncbi:MAG TPA: hypothetical protein VIM07_10020 [Chitinophagaceae bacterium]